MTPVSKRALRILLGIAACAWALLIVGTMFPFLLVSYPPLYIYFSRSPELKDLYKSCVSIQRGQTLDEVKIAMAKYQMLREGERGTGFIVPKFSGDICLVGLSADTRRRVTSVSFKPD